MTPYSGWATNSYHKPYPVNRTAKGKDPDDCIWKYESTLKSSLL